MSAWLLLPFVLSAEPKIVLHQDAIGSDIRVTGVVKEDLNAFVRSKPTTDQWQSVLRIAVAAETDEETDRRPAVLGQYSVVEGVIRFEPRFPLAAGTTYRVVFHPDRLIRRTGKTAIRTSLTIPRPDTPPTVVRAVYPSADVLPENTLRMYVHFSAPMRRGDVYPHVRLLRKDGTPVLKPFLELDEELWNPDGTRFTLLFDPGRIKNLLASKAEAGPNLIRGETHTLEILKTWKDGHGRELKETFRKTFKAGPPHEVPVTPEDWKIAAPASGTRDALVLTFPSPLDRALLNRMIAVEGPDGKRIDGEINVTERETRWAMTPMAKWTGGRHRLVIDTSLEDICGNRVGSPFEIDVFRPATRRLEVKTVTREFSVR